MERLRKNAKMKKINEIADELGISADELEPYGHYKAKLSETLYSKLAFKNDGKLILVTAINPTPAGEGKTTVSVGLAEAMAKIGKKAMLALREPSLGPVFGIKGGAAGGGLVMVAYLVLIVAFFYFFVMRPQKKEQKKMAAMLSTLAVGDCVLTSSGFYGIVIDITDDTVIVEFGNNKNCRIPMQKSAISQIEKADAE